MIMCNLHLHLSVLLSTTIIMKAATLWPPTCAIVWATPSLRSSNAQMGKRRRNRNFAQRQDSKPDVYSPLIYLRPVRCGEKPSKDVFHKKTFVDPGCDPVKAVESKSGSDFLRKQLRCKVPSRSSVPALGHALVLGPGSSLWRKLRKIWSNPWKAGVA